VYVYTIFVDVQPFTYEISIAVAKIIRDGGRCPNKLQIDREKEFYNATLKKTQLELLFSNDSVSRRAVQSYAQK